jgi:hypothetical protein
MPPPGEPEYFIRCLLRLPTTPLPPQRRSVRQGLADSGTAALECPLAISRRSLLKIVDGR